jgi:hypothetical protein
MPDSARPVTSTLQQFEQANAYWLARLTDRELEVLTSNLRDELQKRDADANAKNPR